MHGNDALQGISCGLEGVESALGFAGFGELFIAAMAAPLTAGTSLAIGAGIVGMTVSGTAIAGATGHGPLAC